MRDYFPEVKKYFSPATGFDTNLTAVRAQGTTVVCHDGNTYLDFSSGVAVLNVGHTPPRVVEAIRRQTELFLHSGDIFVNEPYIKFAEKLASIVPVKDPRFFFSNSGSEAVEGCLKVARKVSKRPAIICFRGGFHGRSFGAASVTSSTSKYREGYHPFVGSIYRARFPYLYRMPGNPTPDECADEALAELSRMFDYEVKPHEVAAIIIEAMQGEAGYIPAPKKFIHGLRRICDEHGIYLIIDEVQTGMGRTGHWFASQYYGVAPDLISIGKGIASGMPISVVCGTKEIMSQWAPGSHGTTFGGNVISCAAALATIETIEQENLLPKVRANGERILERLEKMKQKYAIVGDVRGAGHFIGIEFVKTKKGKEPNAAAREGVMNRCLEERLILVSCGTYGNVIRFIPPLIAGTKEIGQALDILEGAIAKSC